MKTVSITKAKNNLSALIDGLKGGSPVLILDRGRPVARLEAVMARGEERTDGALSRLVREGVVRPRRAPLARAVLRELPPHPKAGASAVAALIEERREGR